MSMSRRQIIGGVFGAGALFALSACSSGGSGDAASSAPATAIDPNKLDGALERIKASGVIRIGMEGVYAPYGYHEGDKLVGIEKEIGDLLAADLGVTAEYVETKWDSLIAGMDVNKYDLVLNNITPTDERKQKYDFTIPYARSIGKAAVHKDSGITSFDQLAGKKSAQTPTSNWGSQATALGAEVVPVEGFVQAIELVSTGRADTTLNDLVSFQEYLKQHPDAPIVLLEGEVDIDIRVAGLINKGNEDFKAALDESITKHLADGSFAAIMEKYTGTDLTPLD